MDDLKPTKRCITIWKDTWKNSECNYKYSKYPSICNVPEKDNLGFNTNGAASVVGGFTFSWSLLKSSSEVPTETVAENVTGLWKTKSKGLIKKNWVMVLIMSLVQMSQMANINEKVVSEAVLRYRWSADIVLDSPCLNESQIFDAIFKAGNDLGLTWRHHLDPQR